MDAVVYIHGSGGSVSEALHYRSLFPGSEVIGFDYRAEDPWTAGDEFQDFFRTLSGQYSRVTVVAVSIGAFFTLSSLVSEYIDRAFLVSPVVDMERLILDMMAWAGVSEEELHKRGRVETDFGQTLSWDYLTWVREHPFFWNVPTEVLYGSEDNMQTLKTVSAFCKEYGAGLTVLEGCPHWLHTEEQMALLDSWIVRCL